MSILMATYVRTGVWSIYCTHTYVCLHMTDPALQDYHSRSVVHCHPFHTDDLIRI